MNADAILRLAREHLYVGRTDCLGNDIIRGWDAFAAALPAEHAPPDDLRAAIDRAAEVSIYYEPKKRPVPPGGYSLDYADVANIVVAAFGSRPALAGSPAVLLPDTFIERAIQTARLMGESNPSADATVMLSAFEASTIRRGRVSGTQEGTKS